MSSPEVETEPTDELPPAEPKEQSSLRELGLNSLDEFLRVARQKSDQESDT